MRLLIDDRQHNGETGKPTGMDHGGRMVAMKATNYCRL
jgi:hypothetical protein